jgi:hypothetical protein
VRMDLAWFIRYCLAWAERVQSRNGMSSFTLTATMLINSLHLGQTNAAPEWQARSVRRHSRKPVGACPLEGLVMWSPGLYGQALPLAFFGWTTEQAR